MKFSLILLSCLIVWMSLSSIEGKKKKKKVLVDSNFFFSGATPSGSTKWKQESPGVISTYVDTSHLKFDRIPKYFCTVVSDKHKSLFGTLDNQVSALVNITGKHKPVKATTSGFKIRLKYKDLEDKSLTDSIARIGGWRIRWTAITEGHSLIEKARNDVENEKYDLGIEEKPVGDVLGHIKLLEAFAREDVALIQGIMGIDYELPKSKRPKVITKKKKVDNSTNTEKTNSSKKEDGGKKEDAKSDSSTTEGSKDGDQEGL